VYLMEGASLSDHCVHRPRATKSAGKTKTAPAVTAVIDVADSAGPAGGSDDKDKFIPPRQKKARHVEPGVSE
jgi:hypothetical protein